VSDTSELPNDIDALRALVLAQRAELELARSGLIEQRYEIDALKARLPKLLRATFGRSSEKLRSEIEQLELVLADLDEQLAEIGTAIEPATNDTPDDQPSGAGRSPLSPALPRQTVEHAAPRDGDGGCPACGGTLRPLGTNETEILDYVPGGFHVVRHVRPKLSCRSCETIVQAPMPELPIRRGRAGAGLLAHVAVAKFCDHQPLHRQAEQYARADINLSRSTLADMMGQTAALLRPLIEALARHVLNGERVHADDTVVPVLAPGQGRTKTGRLWTYVRDDGRSVAPSPWAYSIATHPIARASTRASTCAASKVSCRPMATPASPGCMATPSSRPPAWRTRGGKSSTCSKPRNRRWRKPRWRRSPHSTGLRQRSAVVRPMSVYAPEPTEARHCSPT
jgi:transposase